MANYFLCMVLQRFLLPIIIAACCLFRPVGLSFPYLLLFLYLPLVPVATARSMKGHTGYYLKMVIAISVLICLVQIAFQIVLVSLGSDIIEHCGLLEMILRHVGLVRMDDNLPVKSIIEWIVPEIVMLITSVCLFIALRKISLGRVRDIEANDSENLISTPSTETTSWTDEKLKVVTGFGVFLSLITILMAGILKPSAPGGVYFIVYLGAGTWWACYKELNRAFAYVSRILMVFIAAHITAFLAYQTPWPQELIFEINNNSIPRYLGFDEIFTSSSNCTDDTDIRLVEFNNKLNIDSYLNPIAILLCYYTLGVTSSLLLRPKLMRTSTKRLKDSKNNDPTSSGPDDNTTDGIAMESMETKGQEVPSTDTGDNTNFIEQIIIGVENIAGIIYKNSYIFTNIIMMTWSILYHSWLTFVLLIWADILWMIPNQRKAMLRSSPFIVIYAMFLLFAGYIYGMDLTNEELPVAVNTTGINLEQIGFIRYARLPFIHILAKCVFTVMFWVTLRQMFQERKLKKQKSTLADMVAPLQVTVGAATADLAPQTAGKKTSGFMTNLGILFNSILVKGWIWIVIITLFVSGMAGSRMTGFRIVYMALFLLFILMFQFSWRIWKKFIYGFWLCVIAYGMTILILVYSYQFDNFPNYWHQYIGINTDIQKDIGLKQYDKKEELFLNLVNPTLVVIMTVVQLHYFHKKFLKMLEVPVRHNSDTSHVTNSSTNYTNVHKEDSEDEDDPTLKEEESLIRKFRFRKMTKAELKQLVIEFGRQILIFSEIIWVFLELHLIKIVMLVAFLLSIYSVCLLHITFVILTVIAVASRTNLQVLVSRILSLFISILFLTKMIYQVNNIKHENYNVTCNNITNPDKINNADWFGLKKADDGLGNLLQGYIFYLAIVTIHAVVMFRQSHKRLTDGKATRKPQIMFPKITRANSEKDTLHMLRYLLNYGFFKFGIEICLMALVVLIGTRMDLLACFYAIWLCCLFAIARESKARVWRLFLLFIVVSTIVQYIIIVGIPPGVCVVYPWNTELLKKVQKWAMLPDASLVIQVKKLIFDFILLLLVSRQGLVFRIEQRYNSETSEFPGGINKPIIEDIHKHGFSLIKNPTPDFTSHVRNWLDILKRGVLLGFFWFTLAIVFLTGTNRVSLFSLGYLIGSFIFLWQGSDFYLRPIKNIIYWWKFLLGYNVFVIATKAYLQIGGCLFFKDIATDACWFVQILGITCIQKFEIISNVTDETCKVPQAEVGLFWDGICFGFLIMQLRIFHSYYFCHIVNDTKASNILASRGAQLIEGLRAKQMKQQIEHENEILQKIKLKMDRIKATQQKLLQPIAEPETHAQAIRSGDYYMFEELDNKVELDIMNPKTEEEEGGRLAQKMTLGQLLALKMEDMKRQNEANELELAKKRRTSLQEEQTTEQTPIIGRSIMSEPISRPSDRRLSKSERTEITDDIAQPDNQKPSTSRDASDESRKDSLHEVDDVQFDDDDEVKGQKQSYLRGFRFIWTFIESLLISLSVKINSVSRNYRYVMKVLAKEKKTLKSSEGFGMGLKISSALFWGQNPANSEQTTDPAIGASTISLGSVSLDVVDSPRKSWGSSRETTPRDQLYKGPQQKQTTPSKRSQISRDRDSHDQKQSDGDIEDFSTKEHSAIVELLTAIWFAILSHTDFVCYLMVFLNQVKSASVLSLPLPLMVFFWGTMTIPRPSKTFWITLIAYTQTVVLLKCISQFELLWWNQTAITPNQPLAPARIFGIEKKKGYATYDLVLLLVVFFHRFMLKSMGLWKSEFKEETLPEGTYKMQNGNNSNGTVEIENEKQPATILTQGDNQLALTKVDSETALVSVSDDVVQVSNVIEETSNYFPGVIKLAAIKYTSSVKSFFKALLGSASRATKDVYAYMFMCDFINFLVLVFGFTSFGSSQGDGGVTAYLSENKVPIAFLVMLLLQFVLIIIDRALYLRKYMLGKIVFQFALIVVIHIWMFFVLPNVTERSFNAKNPPVIYYLVKCFYLLFSAFQIRCGYPSRIIGNFLTKGFNILNLMLYKAYLAIPFLFELRTLMDWIWTDTSMTLFDWLKMEDIFSNIFQLKCGRTMESKFPQPRGSRKTTISKYIMGGGMLFALIASIWFPLAMFALGNTVGEANPPFDVTVSLRIGPYEPIYAMSAQDNNIISFSEKDFGSLQKQYSKDRTALTFLTGYEAADITAVVLASNSTSIWNISPPDRTRLYDDIVKNHSLTCRFKYTVSRKTYNKENPGVISEERTFNLEKNNPYRPILASMLTNQTDGGFIMPQMFPKFLKVKNAGALKPIPQLFTGFPEDGDESLLFRNLSLNLFHTMGTIDTMWWEVKEVCNDSLYNNILSAIPLADCTATLVTYLFNDKIFPPTLQWLTAGGIIGMYSTFIILFARLIRGIFSGMSSKIMFDDLPYVDRVLQLCLDIYLVRESFELALEEDLFAKLIFLYRSPETMIKWTRPKDEKLNDDDDDIDDVPNDDDDDDDENDRNDTNIRKRKVTPV